jgi:hypothetical protein
MALAIVARAPWALVATALEMQQGLVALTHLSARTCAERSRIALPDRSRRVARLRHSRRPCLSLDEGVERCQRARRTKLPAKIVNRYLEALPVLNERKLPLATQAPRRVHGLL